MPRWLDNFAVRIHRRLYENRGKVCPSCGESDSLLITKDGRCANCASRNKEEKHHLLGKAFRVSKEERKLVIPVSPNAHRLLSDLQAGHPMPDTDDPDSRDFLESQLWELLASVAELWFVLTYLNEKREVAKSMPVLVVILLALLFLIYLGHLDISRLLDLSERKLHGKQA